MGDNEAVPPKPLARELCDAIGAERIRKIVPDAKTTQAKDITGVGAAADIADASCDAVGDGAGDGAGDGVLRVVFRRYGQTAVQTPAERVTQAVDKRCGDMRSGRWAEEQIRFKPGLRADPMEPPGTEATGTCKITGRYDVLEKPHATVSLVFGLKGDLVEVDLSRELSGSAQLDDNLVKLMRTEVTLLATDVFAAGL